MREILFHALHVTLFGRVVLSRSYENHLLLWRVSERFDELPPRVELVEGISYHLNDMVRGHHDHSLVVLAI